MSRGPRNIERKVMEIFTNNPNQFFGVGKLCSMIWPGINRVEHKHRVSVIRAAERITNKSNWTKCSFPDWCGSPGVVVFVGPKAAGVAEAFVNANRWRTSFKCS